jgi:hypothetical protein
MKWTALSTALALSAGMLFAVGSAQAASRSKHGHHHHHPHHAAHHACMFHMMHGHGSMHQHSRATLRKSATRAKLKPRAGHQH